VVAVAVVVDSKSQHGDLYKHLKVPRAVLHTSGVFVTIVTRWFLVSVCSKSLSFELLKLVQCSGDSLRIAVSALIQSRSSTD
jgi:hypothetical protein